MPSDEHEQRGSEQSRLVESEVPKCTHRSGCDRDAAYAVVDLPISTNGTPYRCEKHKDAPFYGAFGAELEYDLRLLDGSEVSVATDGGEDLGELHWNVVNGHHLRGTKRGEPTAYGPGDYIEWECKGCGELFESKSGLEECPSPTEWVQRGCPGDGIGWCRSCDALFTIDLQEIEEEHGGTLLAPCPECGENDWIRSDTGRPESASETAAADGGAAQEEPDRSEFAPNGIERRPDSHEECEKSGCETSPEWRIQMHNGTTFYYVWACDDHVAEYWGYHPEGDDYVADGGVQIPDDGESRFTEEDKERWEELAESPLEELSDGEITSKIRLSVKRRYDFPEWVLMFEYGAPGSGGSVCDCLAANTLPSRNYKVLGFEFKASRSDWLREVRDGQKADYFVRMADEFYVVAPKGVVEESEIPDGWGYLELKPNSEQLYKIQDSDLTEHQQGEPSRRFWVRFVKQTVGRQTNYTQEDLREARSRGYDEAKEEAITDREVERDLGRLRRKAENWEQLQDSEVGFLAGYEFEEDDARTLELAYELVRMVRRDGYGSIRGDLDRLQTQIERTQESILESTDEIAEGIDTLEERIEDGADPLPEALEQAGDSP